MEFEANDKGNAFENMLPLLYEEKAKRDLENTKANAPLDELAIEHQRVLNEKEQSQLDKITEGYKMGVVESMVGRDFMVEREKRRTQEKKIWHKIKVGLGWV